MTTAWGKLLAIADAYCAAPAAGAALGLAFDVGRAIVLASPAG